MAQEEVEIPTSILTCGGRSAVTPITMASDAGANLPPSNPTRRVSSKPRTIHWVLIRRLVGTEELVGSFVMEYVVPRGTSAAYRSDESEVLIGRNLKLELISATTRKPCLLGREGSYRTHAESYPLIDNANGV